MAKAREAEPWNELAAIEAALARGDLARGYALRGEERYFRERALVCLRSKAESLGYEVCLHEVERESESSDFRLARLVDDLSGGGLFAARRLILVRNPGELLKKVEGEESALTRAALAFVKSAEDAGTLVLSDASLRVDHALVKAILAAGGLAPSFRKLWENPPRWRPDPLQSELVQWVLRRAGELGLRLTGPQALYVGAATGNDLSALDGELETLRASGGRDLRESVRWTAGGTPWNVADHVLGGDLPRALSGIEALFQGGFQEKSGKRLLDPSALAIMLVSALQRGASTCLEFSRPSAGAPAGARGEGSPAQREAVEARARRRPSADWRALLEEAAGLERELKSGAGLDANDFARLALRWALDARPRAAATGVQAQRSVR
jgi:DNA polymerase III delta subunit